VAVGVLAAAVLATGNTRIAGAFTTDPEVAALASKLVLFVALYIIVDNAQATAIGALRGYKDTRAPMLIALVGYWVVALPLGATLGFGWIGAAFDVYGFWIGLATGLTLVAAALSWRLFRLSRRAVAAP
jgi:MATE family multidrug resistance protein